MKFLDWYVKMSAWWCFDWSFYGIVHDQDWLLCEDHPFIPLMFILFYPFCSFYAPLLYF